jgi:hypothetical protein
VSSGDQEQESPPVKEKTGEIRENGKDGAIELCFELLSSGRRLDEVLAELGAKSSTPDDKDGDPEGPVDAIGEPAGPSLTELLIKRAKENLALPARPTEMERGRPATTAVADRVVSSGIARAIAAPLADFRLPAVRSEIGSWGRPADGRRIGSTPLAIAGWRGIARLTGALLLFAALIAAAPSVTYELLRMTHRTAGGHPGPGVAEKAPASPHRMPTPASVRQGEPTRAPAIAVAETKPPASRPSTAAARQPPLDAPMPARSATAARRIPPPIVASATPSAPAAVAAVVPASALAKLRDPALWRNGGSAVTAKTAPVAAKLSTSEMTALVARGDALFATGDVTNARLFYRRGADGGDGPAALRLGESFDPAFLAQAGVGHVPGDAKEAAYWYWRALDLGVRDAALLLQSLHLARPQ